MGRFATIALLLSAGCGRLGFTSEAPDAAVTADLAPVVCMEPRWPIAVVPGPAVDLAAIATPSGATLTWAPLAGGDLSGITLDASWAVVSDMSGTTIKTGTWYSSSLGYMDNTLVMAESDNGSIKLDVVDPSIASASEIACPSASHVSEPPFVKAGADIISPTVRSTGMVVNPFDNTWSELPIDLSAPSGPAIGVTAASFGSIAEVVWSTDSACFLEQLTSMSSGVGSENGVPCAAPRLAASDTALALVFEAPAGVYLSMGGPSQISADTATLIAPNGTSPRVVFDGTRFWISYLDGGEVIVGYVASDGSFRSTTVAATPEHDAYELTMVNGAPWIFAVDGAGLGGHRICLH